MALVSLPGAAIPIGIGWPIRATAFPTVTSLAIDDINEAVVMIGQIVTADGASHTLNTSGSSSIGWQSGTTVFANGATTFKVGIAAVDTTTGPPARAVNVANVITFDVSASFTGGAGVTSGAWHTSVPTAGTKTVANGDLVAVCMQMTARGGSDVVRVAVMGSNAQNQPTITGYFSAAYAVQAALPNAIITFADGALGYFFGTETLSTSSVRTWNSGSAQAEYGQLFQMPFGMKVSGAYGWIDPDADFDIVLYTDPLGTPSAARTVSIDANVTAVASGNRIFASFSTPVIVRPNQPVVVAFKPGASSISAYYKTFASATHRIADPYGANGYGVQRVSGAFADSNSSLDHYYMGLMASAFENPAGAAYQLGMS